MSDEPEPFVTRSVTVSEVMNGEGDRNLRIEADGDPEPWDLIGMLEGAVLWLKHDLRRLWDDEEEDAD